MGLHFITKLKINRFFFTLALLDKHRGELTIFLHYVSMWPSYLSFLAFLSYPPLSFSTPFCLALPPSLFLGIPFCPSLFPLQSLVIPYCVLMWSSYLLSPIVLLHPLSSLIASLTIHVVLNVSHAWMWHLVNHKRPSWTLK